MLRLGCCMFNAEAVNLAGPGAAQVLRRLVPGKHEHRQTPLARRSSVMEATHKPIARHIEHFDVANREIEAFGQHAQCICPIMRGQDHADTDIGQSCLQCLRRKDFILHNLDGQGIQLLLGDAPLLIVSLCPSQIHTTL